MLSARWTWPRDVPRWDEPLWAARSPSLTIIIIDRPYALRTWCWRRMSSCRAAQRLRARLEPLLDRAGQQELDATRLLWLLAWAALEQGVPEQAQALVQACLARCGPATLHRIQLEALRVQGMLATRQSHWEVAATALEEALALARAMPAPYAEAKALFACGQLAHAQGHLVQARERYQAARAILDRLGELPYRDQVKRALAALPTAARAARHA